MADITPSFVMEYEREMRAISEEEYVRRRANMWSPKVLRKNTIARKSERIAWLLSTATIEPVGPSGAGVMPFESMVSQTTELPTLKHAKGIRVAVDEIEDLDGTGLDILGKWSGDIGGETAYYPQRLASQFILNGAATDGTANAYDGLPFFSDNSAPHKNNPFNSAAGSYANWLHGSVSGSYPGALPIDESVTVDVALANLGKLIAYVAGFKMPNGIDPRFLRVAYLIGAPRLAPRLQQLTNAKYIAQAAASGGGSGDVEALIKNWGLAEPVIAEEFAGTTSYTFKTATADPTSGFISFKKGTCTGNDTTYYAVLEQMNSSTLGGILDVERKPFKTTYYSGDNGGNGLDAVLDRADELEYHTKGRRSVQPGHPYTIIRVDAT